MTQSLKVLLVESKDLSNNPDEIRIDSSIDKFQWPFLIYREALIHKLISKGIDSKVAYAFAVKSEKGLRKRVNDNRLQNYFAKTAGPHKFSTTQINLPENLSDLIKAFAAAIPNEDLAEDGREDDIHLTLKYGLHTEDSEEVKTVLSEVESVQLILGKTNCFFGEDHDVLWVGIKNAEWPNEVNSIISELEHTDTQVNYTPHVTVAYLKPGLGSKYTDNFFIEGKSFTAEEVEFNSFNGESTLISLLEAKIVSSVTKTSKGVLDTPKPMEKRPAQRQAGYFGSRKVSTNGNNGHSSLFNRSVSKAACEPGQTSAQTGCTPAEDGEGKKPSMGQEEEPIPYLKPPSEYKPEEAPLEAMTEDGKKVVVRMNSDGVWAVYVDEVKDSQLWTNDTKEDAKKKAEKWYNVEFQDTKSELKSDEKLSGFTQIGASVSLKFNGEKWELTVDYDSWGEFATKEAGLNYVKDVFGVDLVSEGGEPKKDSELSKNGLGIDTSQWEPHNGYASFWAKYIANMEKLANEGKGFDNVVGWNVLSDSDSNEYAKAAYQAYLKLKSQQIQKEKDLSTKDWKVVGQLGSNPGKQMEDESGQKWYVKQSKSPSHASNEVLANKLYELDNASVPHASLADGGNSVASQWMNDVQPFDKKDKLQKEAAQENFAVHAWLANWDAVGLVFDNQVKIGNGGVATFDTGGCMYYRAQGGDKPFKSICEEWDTLRDPVKSKNAAEVFGKMTNDQLLASAQKILSIPDESIKSLVDKFEGNLSQDKELVVKTLIDRKKWIQNWVDKNKKAVATGQPLPKGGPKPVLPAKPILPPSQAPLIRKKIDALWAAAEKGDIAGVESVVANPNYKAGSAKKLYKAKMALLSTLKSGAVVGTSTPTSVPVSSLPVDEPSTKTKPIKIGDIKSSNFPDKPKFISSKVAQKEVESLFALAKTGDLDALQAYPNSPSGKVNEYKSALAVEVHNQLHPPLPPKSYTGQLSHINKVLKSPVGVLESQKIGLYLVVEEPGVPDVDFPEVILDTDHTGIYLSNKTMQKVHGKAWNDMSPETQRLIKNYTNVGNRNTNSELRGAYSHDYAEKKKLSEAVKKAAEDFLAHCVDIPVGTVLNRSMSPKGPGDIQQIINSVGKVIQDPGFGSTSIGKGLQRVIKWKLKTAPGFKAMYIASKSDYEVENEMLLPPGTRYLITKVTARANNISGYDVEAILLPTLPDQCCREANT